MNALEISKIIRILTFGIKEVAITTLAEMVVIVISRTIELIATRVVITHLAVIARIPTILEIIRDHHIITIKRTTSQENKITITTTLHKETTGKNIHL